MAEAATRSDPGGLANVGASRDIRGEVGAANGQHERVRRRKADLLDLPAPPLRGGERATVAGAADHRDVMSGRSQQDGMHLGHLRLGEVVLPQTPADRHHVGVGDCEPQPGEHVRGRVRGALAPGRGKQDDPQGGGGGDRVQDLEVPGLLAIRPPRRGRAGEAGHDLDPRGGQPEHAVKFLQVLTDIGGSRGRGVGGWGRGEDRHGFATAVDPAVQQGLDAIRDPKLVRVVQDVDDHALAGCGARPSGRRSAGTRCTRRRADRATCDQEPAREYCGGEQARPRRAGQPPGADAVLHLVSFSPPSGLRTGST